MGPLRIGPAVRTGYADRLCSPAAAGGGIARGAVDERAVQRIQLRKQGSNFGQERVCEDGGYLFIAAAARVPDKLADVHLESGGEAFERAEGGDGFAIFNFRDVGAGHLHATGKLALAEVAGFADFADLPGNLQPGLGGSWRGGGTGHQLWGRGSRLLDVKRPAAFSAKGVSSAVLNQAAEIATYDLACVDADQCGSHRLCAERQSWISGVLCCTTICATLGEMNHNCQVQT